MKTAVVIGAGPAGLSAALGLLRAGVRAHVLDQRVHGQSRVCGGYLNAEACRHLRWLGAMDEIKKEASAVAMVSLTTPKTESLHRASFDGGETLGLSRDRLEDILADRVRANGGTVEFGSRVTAIQKAGDTWKINFRSGNSNHEINSDVLISAAGRFANTEAGGLGTPKFAAANEGGWYGWNAMFRHVNHNEGSLSLHFYNRGYIGLLALKDGLTNACGLVYLPKKDRLSIETLYETATWEQPRFRRLMEKSARITDWKGVGPLPFGKKLTPNDDTLSVGDAAAVGDPFMGEGIGRALGAGPMLHRLITENAESKRLGKTYYAIWNQTYGARFRLGWWLRQSLYNRPFAPPVLNFLVGHPFWLERAMPHFQSGYKDCKKTV